MLNSRVESVNLAIAQTLIDVEPVGQSGFGGLGRRFIPARFLFDDLYDNLLARLQGRTDQVFQRLEIVGRNIADISRVIVSMLILYLALPTPGNTSNIELR